MLKILYLFFLTGLISFWSTAAGKDVKKEINDFIFGLKYKTEEVLKFEENKTIETYKKKEGYLDKNNTFIVITRNVSTIVNKIADISVPQGKEYKIYPGSILLANTGLFDNPPNTIEIERSSLEFSVNLPDIEVNKRFTINSSYAIYQEKLEKLLNSTFKSNPEYTVEDLFQPESIFVYSKDQLRVKFGPDFKYTGLEEDIDFKSIQTNEKLIIIHRFKAIFYAVSVEMPKNPADLFDSNVIINDLKNKFESKNPPFLVDSITYGRIVYVKVETSSTSEDAKLILEKKLTFNLKNSNSVEKYTYMSKLNDLNMYVYTLDEGTKLFKPFRANTLYQVYQAIINAGKCNRTNIGYPLSYSGKFLRDNATVKLNLSVNYLEWKREEYEKGILEIKQTGSYSAEWTLKWEIRSFDDNGNEIRRTYNMKENNDIITGYFDKEIELAGNCYNIYVKARSATDLVHNQWKTIIEISDIPLIKHRKFHIWGTSTDPKYVIVPYFTSKNHREKFLWSPSFTIENTTLTQDEDDYFYG